jgi:hypothetical protein
LPQITTWPSDSICDAAGAACTAGAVCAIAASGISIAPETPIARLVLRIEFDAVALVLRRLFGCRACW